MKTLKPLKLIATLALAVASLSAAHAGVIATMPNDAEGFVELSDGTWDAKTAATFNGICEAGSFMAKSYGRTINNVYGCWSYNKSDDTINVSWDSGGRFASRTYQNSDFTLTPYGQRLRNASNSDARNARYGY